VVISVSMMGPATDAGRRAACIVIHGNLGTGGTWTVDDDVGGRGQATSLGISAAGGDADV
jgi:hypothetical protein